MEDSAPVKVFIVTWDNGRVWSVHLSIETADDEMRRALTADEIYATDIEEREVKP